MVPILARTIVDICDDHLSCGPKLVYLGRLVLNLSDDLLILLPHIFVNICDAHGVGGLSIPLIWCMLTSWWRNWQSYCLARTPEVLIDPKSNASKKTDLVDLNVQKMDVDLTLLTSPNLTWKLLKP